MTQLRNTQKTNTTQYAVSKDYEVLEGLLFAVEAASCRDCGRALQDRVCLWCSASPTGRAAGEKATKAVKRDPEWADRAAKWLGDRIVGTCFTADELVAALGLPQGSPNQVGATIRSWASADLIRPDGVVGANRKQSHGRLIRVWKVAR